MSAVQLLSPTSVALLDLYKLDYNYKDPSCPLLHFCNYSNSNGTNISFGGVTYAAYPIEATGFERSIAKGFPSPAITLSNVTSAITPFILVYKGLLGARVTRYQVFASNLDGVPGANPADIESVETFNIDSYTEDNTRVKFQLKHPLDFGRRAFLPARRIASITND